MGYIFNIWFPYFNTYFWYALIYTFIIFGLLFARITWKEYFFYVALLTFLFISTNLLFFQMNSYEVLARYNSIAQ